jgi:hypothetical protein
MDFSHGVQALPGLCFGLTGRAMSHLGRPFVRVFVRGVILQQIIFYDLDFLLGIEQRFLAEAYQLGTALIALQSALERQLATFEVLHEGLKLGQGRFKIDR